MPSKFLKKREHSFPLDILRIFFFLVSLLTFSGNAKCEDTRPVFANDLRAMIYNYMNRYPAWSSTGSDCGNFKPDNADTQKSLDEIFIELAGEAGEKYNSVNKIDPYNLTTYMGRYRDRMGPIVNRWCNAFVNKIIPDLSSYFLIELQKYLETLPGPEFQALSGIVATAKPLQELEAVNGIVATVKHFDFSADATNLAKSDSVAFQGQGEAGAPVPEAPAHTLVTAAVAPSADPPPPKTTDCSIGRGTGLQGSYFGFLLPLIWIGFTRGLVKVRVRK